MNNETVLRAEQLVKRFTQGEQTISVLDGAGLEIRRGERVAIVGRSGSGKSTLLHLLAGLDAADAGDVEVCGRSLFAMDAEQRAQIRAQHMGFVYQNHHLLAEFSALENVMLAMRIAGMEGNPADQSAALLHEVGLGERLEHTPAMLSGGERQRVAVARALAGSPDIVLADEPTGNLDRANAEQVTQLLAQLALKHATAFLVVTHDEQAFEQYDRVLRIADGRLVDHD